MPPRHQQRQWQRQPWLLLLLSALLLSLASALHADRAGKEDWLRQNVGRVTRAVHTKVGVCVYVCVCECVCVCVRIDGWTAARNPPLSFGGKGVDARIDGKSGGTAAAH